MSGDEVDKSEGTPQARGRPRDEEAGERILDAALALLGEAGYAGLSMEAVARRAGVSKPTLYRRWPSKADLATAALARFQAAEPRAAGGTTRERLVAHLRAFRRSLLRPNGMATLGTLLAEEERLPELLALFRERIVARRRGWIREILLDGVANEEVRADVDADAVAALLVGSFYARYLSEGGVAESWPARVVAALWPAIER
jgi:AcrR family transcriptional regulator